MRMENLMTKNSSSQRRAVSPRRPRTDKKARPKARPATENPALPPGLAQPALRALAAGGYTTLDRLSRVTELELSKLHGMGPKAIGIIREALNRQGKSFKS